MNIIIASDSRGRGLTHHIEQYKQFQELPNHTFIHILMPGATIETLRQEISKQITKLHTQQAYTSITLLAGICNFTSKIKIYDHQGTFAGTQIVYNHTTSKTDNIIEELQSMASTFNTDTTTLKIASIPPANLKKYTKKQLETGKLQIPKYSEDELLQMQALLEANINTVNTQISIINTRHHLATIRWDRDIKKLVTQHSGKKNQNLKKVKKFVYTHLPDGVHADDFIRRKWFTVACRTIVEEVKSYQHVHQQVDEPFVEVNFEEDNEEEECRESWDYKRLKLT